LRGSFANLRGLCVKKWRLGLDVFFTAKNTMLAQSPQRAISRYKPPLERSELRTSEPRRGDIIIEHIGAQNIRTP
jgi:hypothetical protein